MNARYDFQGFEAQLSFEQFVDELFVLVHPDSDARIVGRYSGSTSASLATWDRDFAV